MARLCARPGCSTPAAATFNFDGLNRIVWINPLSDAAAHGAGDLCECHADGLKPPRKWELRDTRPTAPSRHLALSGARGSASDESCRPAAAERRPAPAAPAVPAVLLASGRPREPRVDAPATTPLLARAFRGVGRG